MSDYFQPYIDETGFHIPEYDDIVNDLLQTYRRIFGADVYLENDSQDYQLISIFALKIYDDLLAAMAIYHTRSPATSVGVGLDAVVAINGIRRKKESHSTAFVELKGEPDTEIINGIIADAKGSQFQLPPSVMLDALGKVTVKATAFFAGAVSANPNSIINIVTPTRGWLSVTNPSGAIVGQALEIDAELRARQKISVANPSRSILQGTIGAIAAVSGVSRYMVYENDTSITDHNGIPSHSIGAVIEGGDENEIAQVIYLHKGVGGGTYGDRSATVPASITGEIDTIIQFFRPKYVDISIEVTVKKLAQYTNITPELIKDEIAKYINAFQIGDDLPLSWLWGVSLCKASDLNSSPAFSIIDIKAAINGQSMSANDIATSFIEVVRCYPSDVNIIEV